jgi:hypothetical protein
LTALFQRANLINVCLFWGDLQVEIETEFLKLEPIGFVFVVFFGSILVVQFVAMLFHRFGTLTHILASTEIGLFSKKVRVTLLN